MWRRRVSSGWDKMHKKFDRENIVKGVVLLSSVTAILILSLIVTFLFNEGMRYSRKLIFWISYQGISGVQQRSSTGPSPS